MRNALETGISGKEYCSTVTRETSTAAQTPEAESGGDTVALR